MYITAADPQQARHRPRLGVGIETAANGVKILSVGEESIAAAADLRVGDVVVQAAGRVVTSTGQLIEVIGSQAPGTWLPLVIDRSGTEHEIIAKFPPAHTQKPGGSH